MKLYRSLTEAQTDALLDNVHLTCVTSLTQIIYKSQGPSLGEGGGGTY